MKYVIIGNGTAAVGAIEGIRSADKVGPITVISTEPYHVYGRPLISYMLLGKTTEEKMLQYRPDDFYEKNNVTTMLGRTVQHIDPKKQTVSLASGESVPYDRLCICTGSRPFVPPMEGLDTVENKTSFMTLDDAKHLNEMLGEMNDKRVLIVGAGLIGLKCAEGIYQRVSELTVIDLAPRILPNVLTEVPAAIIQKHIESKGVKFLLGDSVAQFEPNKAHLKSGGTIDFDILVVAVGVRPNTELAAEAGCEVNRGILIDEHSATCVPNIYAAGDCTESYDITAHTSRILALLPNAQFQGACAGVNMAGGEAHFTNAVPMNAIGFFGSHILTAGSYFGDTYVEKSGDTYKKLFYSDNKLNGFILVNMPDRAGIYTSLLRNATPLDEVDFEALKKDPALMAFSAQYRAEKLSRRV